MILSTEKLIPNLPGSSALLQNRFCEFMKSLCHAIANPSPPHTPPPYFMSGLMSVIHFDLGLFPPLSTAVEALLSYFVTGSSDSGDQLSLHCSRTPSKPVHEEGASWAGITWKQITLN